MIVDKTQVALTQQTLAFNEHPIRAVDQNFGNGRVSQQYFKRAKTGQFIDDFFGQPLHLITGNSQVQARHILRNPLGDKLRQNQTRIFQQVFPGLLNGINDVAMQYQFQPVVIRMTVFVQARAEQLFIGHFEPHRRFNHIAGPDDTCPGNCERLDSRSPSFFRPRLRASRGPRSNKVAA